MHEYFQWQARARRTIRRNRRPVPASKSGDFLERTFTGEHHQVAAQLASELHPGRAGDAHLRGRMDWEIRRELANQPADADVLNDGRISSGGDHRAQMVFSFG